MTLAPKTVLFLCTGNYYRSRFAEVLFEAAALRTGLEWQAASRGLAIEFGHNNVGPMSIFAVERLAALKISCRDYLRPPLNACADDLARADLVVALKEVEHRPLLRERFPDWEERVEYWHVHDLDFAPATEALPEIESLVVALVGRLLRRSPLPVRRFEPVPRRQTVRLRGPVQGSGSHGVI